MQLFVTDSGFVHAIPLQSWSDVPHAVKACQRDDSTYERLTDGTFLELHPSFRYQDSVWRMIPYPARRRLLDACAAYKSASMRSVQQASQRVEEMSQLTHQNTDSKSQAPLTTVRIQEAGTAHHGSSNSTASYGSRHTIMGGRKEQETKRRLGAVCSTHNIGKAASKTTVGEEPEPGVVANNETDTNADTCCLGTNF